MKVFWSPFKWSSWILLVLLFSPLLVIGEDLDSLQRALRNADADSLRMRLNEEISGYWLGEDLDSSLHYAHRMLSLALAQKDISNIASAYIQLGWCHGYFYQFEREMAYYHQSLEYSRQHDHPRGIGVAHQNMGVSYMYQGKLDSAAISYEKARPFFERAGDRQSLAYTLNNLGQIYRKTKKYEEAIDIYNASLTIKEALGDEEGMLNTFLNLSSLMSATEDHQEALAYAQRVLDQTSDELFPDHHISALVNAGIAEKNLQRPEAARDLLERARELVKTSNDVQMMFDVPFNLAELAFDQGNYVRSAAYLEETSTFLDDFKDLEALKNFYRLSYEVSKGRNQTAMALEFLEKFQQTNETLLNERTMERVTELEKKYESEKNERTITQLQLQQQNAALDLAASRNERNLFIFLAIGILGIAGFLYYRFNKRKRTAQLLETKNQQISRALEDRETLLKEIHHRVKNNLQVISSLLNLQAGSLHDEAAVDAVREGQNRVKSMALIHQKLYSAEDIRGVDVQEYLENLARELFSAYGIDGEQVRYDINSGGIKLDIDTIIPLGLIVNELITNTLKYAFEGMDSGRLQIGLSEQENKLHVTISDNGKGMDEEEIEKQNSFGWKMIRSLGRKLKAEINILQDQGTTIQLTLSRYKLVV